MPRSYEEGPAYYATGKPTRWRDVRAVLHPPYTLWHLSYVVLGAMVARHVNWTTLEGTLLAFFLAVGVSAHAFDELRGRPLGTTLPNGVLWSAAVLGLAGAVVLGIVGVGRTNAWLIVFIVIGASLVLSYNLELFEGMVHTDLVFALGWGAFPVLTSAFAQDRSITWSALAVAVFAALLSAAQRSLSTPVRLVRRQVTVLDGEMRLADGRVRQIDRTLLLAPSESALRLMSWATVILAIALVLARRGL